MKTKFDLPPKLLFGAIVAAVLLSTLFSTPLIFPVPFNFLGVFFIIGGALLARVTRSLMEHFKTTLDPKGEPSQLLAEGPFKFSRNPMYIGYIVTVLGFAIYMGEVLSFIAPLLLLCALDWVAIPREEKMMKQQFGDDYSKYARKVRRWI